MKKMMIFAAVALTACGDGSSTTTETTSNQPPTTVTAEEISKAYQDNEAKAQMAYGDKPLEISGTVKDIELDFADEPVVKLKGANDQMGMGVSEDGKMTDVSVSGLPKEAAAEIEKGKAMTFVCQSVSEVMGGPQLSDCVVAQDGKAE